MTTVADVIEELENIAPRELADEGDPVGLQVGHPASNVRHICVSGDTSPPVIDSAIDRKAGLLVAHHPLIYSPLKTLAESDPVARRVAKLIRSNTALYVMHTNFDTVPGGVNYVLAELLGVTN